MLYEHYRESTVGRALADVLDDLIQSQQLTPQLAVKVLMQFDRSIADALSNKLRTRATMKGKMDVYRHCDDVWTFEINNCILRLDDETLSARNVKIVACNAKRPEI